MEIVTSTPRDCARTEGRAGRRQERGRPAALAATNTANAVLDANAFARKVKALKHLQEEICDANRVAVGKLLTLGLLIAGAGAAIGLLAAAALARLLQRFLFGVSPFDPVTIAATTALFIVVTLAACLVPAVRVTRIDVVNALRAE